MFWNEFTVLYINTIHIVPPDWSTHLSSSRVHVQGKSCVHTVVRLMYFMRKVREWRVSGAIRSIRAQRNTVTSLNWPPWLHDVRPRPFCLTLLHPLIKHASQVLARRQRLRPELRLASRGLVRVRAICGAGGLHACELASPGHGGWSLASAHTPYSSWHQQARQPCRGIGATEGGWRVGGVAMAECSGGRLTLTLKLTSTLTLTLTLA